MHKVRVRWPVNNKHSQNQNSESVISSHTCFYLLFKNKYKCPASISRRIANSGMFNGGFENEVIIGAF